MWSSRRVLGVLIVAVGGTSPLPEGKPAIAPVAGKSVHASSADLSPQTFDRLHALIRPHANEWRHLRVNWLTDVVAARKKAAAEDKPIVICYTGGAGYNEPLGVC